LQGFCRCCWQRHTFCDATALLLLLLLGASPILADSPLHPFALLSGHG
jgi:hypothetical protein